MLPVIVFALFTGILLASMSNRVSTVANFFSQFNDIMMEMTTAVMRGRSCRCILSDCQDLLPALGFRCLRSNAQNTWAGVILALALQCFRSLSGAVIPFHQTESVQIYQEVLPGHDLCILYLYQ